MINKHTLVNRVNNNANTSAMNSKDILNINLLLVIRDIKQYSQIDKQIAREINKLSRQLINNSNKDYKEKVFEEKTLGKMYCKLRDVILKRHSTL